MLFGLALMGMLLIASALKGTEHELGQQLQSDLIGSNGFIVWIFAILAIGAIGYVPGLETVSNYLLALVMVVVVVRNGGIWSQAQLALQQASKAGPAPSIGPLKTSVDNAGSSSGSGAGGSSSGGSGGGSSGGGDSTASTVSTVMEVAQFAALLA